MLAMWPPVARYAGLGLLVILLLSAVFIAGVDLPRLPAPGSVGSRITGGAALLLAVAASSLFGFVRSRGAKPTNRIDEQATERRNFMLAVGIACAIAAFAVISALAVPVTSLIILGVAAAWVLIWWPRSMRRLSTTTGVVIQRDPAIVFGFLGDFRSQLKYVPGVTSVEMLTDGPIGVGSQFRTQAWLRKGVYEVVEQITDYEPNTRYASTIVSSMRPNSGTVTFEPLPGGTRVSFRFESELSYSGAVLGMGLVRRILQRRLIAPRMMVWARVKKLLESETQPTT